MFVLAAVVAASGCGGGQRRTVARPTGVYLSLGDSYAMGWQPRADDSPETYRHGYAFLLPARLRAKGYRLSLVNLACGGVTVEAMSSAPGCPNPSPVGPRYQDSQLDHAVSYLRENPEEVALVTVAIGMNDLAPCWVSRSVVPCMKRAVARLRPLLGLALERLRRAAGPEVLIVGLSYPDIFLSRWIEGTPEGRSVARASRIVFRKIVNPILKDEYEAVDGIFVDITESTDGYTPLSQTTRLRPFGRIPVAVAEVCRLTWACTDGDVHPNDAGHRKTAEIITEALPKA